jgi:hypothetical protein
MPTIYPYLAEQEINKSILTPIFDTLLAYMPDSIILGTGIFGLLTLSAPLMFLFLFELEALFANKLIAGASQSIFPSLTAPDTNQKCKSGYYSNASRDRISLLKLFGESGSFPTRPLFLISGLFGYLLSSLLAFQEVIRNLDNDFQLRLTLAGTGSALTLVLLYVYFMKAGCTSFFSGMNTILIGLIVGAVGMALHKMFFGIESINFLGLPTLVSKTEKGSPLYVCAPTSAN